jgi:hypothetical protein
VEEAIFFVAGRQLDMIDQFDVYFQSRIATQPALRGVVALAWEITVRHAAV